jgi:E3 SUMO-protein ligase PIAS1
MTANRQTVDIKLQAQDYPALSNMSGASDDSHRLMLFCANAATTHKQDIAFPHQSEIKVNGGEVKANLRGIKGKPGTTKPVDLTPYIRWKPGQYVNKIEVTYALTQNKFYVGLYLVKRATTEQLANRVKDGPKISKDSVLRESGSTTDVSILNKS